MSIKLLGSVKDLENTFWERSDKFTNKNWRLIKRDLIVVKKILFNSLDNTIPFQSIRLSRIMVADG